MNKRMRGRNPLQRGFTIVEVLVALTVAALLLTALSGVVGNTLSVRDDTVARTDATRELRFAMERMVRATRGSERLLLPLADNPKTNWHENVREQSLPASAPEGDSKLASAVLAVTLDPTLDLDADGFADADNDRDGRVDEDPGDDLTYDGDAGIAQIDDDGDGDTDEAHDFDDDEDGTADEDSADTLDDDADGSVDEDPYSDFNGDGRAGIAGFDDDGDGSIDEGSKWDDDEDGREDEDWLDPVVFFMRDSTLIERRPNFNPVNGRDFSEYPIADRVTYFRVERLPDSGKRAELVEITLELSLPDGEPTRQKVRVRVGAGS